MLETHLARRKICVGEIRCGVSASFVYRFWKLSLEKKQMVRKREKGKILFGYEEFENKKKNVMNIFLFDILKWYFKRVYIRGIFEKYLPFAHI